MSDFTDAPVSLGERRALAEDDATKWSARELLVHMLREHDNGSCQLDGVVVCFLKREGEFTRTGIRRSKISVLETVGLLEVAKHDLLRE
jgi:hypothetical protein